MPDDYRQIAAAEAARLGVPADLVSRLIGAESNWDPQARSPKGALGLMQLMPQTAQEMGVDPMNPVANIQGGIKYLKSLLDRYPGRPDLAVAAYNAGPGAVDQAGGVPKFKETQDYVQKVTGGNMAEGQPDWDYDIPGVGPMLFPGSMTKEQVDQAARNLHLAWVSNQPLKEPDTYEWGRNKSLGGTALKTVKGFGQGLAGMVTGIPDTLMAVKDAMSWTPEGMVRTGHRIEGLIDEAKQVASGDPQAGGRALALPVTMAAGRWGPPMARAATTAVKDTVAAHPVATGAVLGGAYGGLTKGLGGILPGMIEGGAAPWMGGKIGGAIGKGVRSVLKTVPEAAELESATVVPSPKQPYTGPSRGTSPVPRTEPPAPPPTEADLIDEALGKYRARGDQISKVTPPTPRPSVTVTSPESFPIDAQAEALLAERAAQRAPTLTQQPVTSFEDGILRERNPKFDPSELITPSRSSGFEPSGTPGLSAKDLQSVGMHPSLRITGLTEGAANAIKLARQARAQGYIDDGQLASRLKAILETEK